MNAAPQFVVFSVEKGRYLTADGWEHCPSQARLLSHGEANEIVANHLDTFLVARRLDSSLFTPDLQFINCGEIVRHNYVHPEVVHTIATAVAKQFETPVVIPTKRERTNIVDDAEVLHMVAKSTIRNFRTNAQRRIERRFEVSLRDFDVALDQYRQRRLTLLLREAS